MNQFLKFSGLLITVFALSSTISFAQDEDINVGGGLVFGSGVLEGSDLDNDLGLRADGVYTFNEQFRGAVDITFFFPHEEGGVKFTVWELNFNGHYLFFSEDEINLYGLGGINLTFLATNVDDVGSDSNSEIGLNLGGGIEYALDFADLFGEIKYAISDADQLSIGAGLRFDI